jgi:hypothetical protein
MTRLFTGSRHKTRVTGRGYRPVGGQELQSSANLDNEVPDAVYEQARAEFSAAELARLTLAIAAGQTFAFRSVRRVTAVSSATSTIAFDLEW